MEQTTTTTETVYSSPQADTSAGTQTAVVTKSAYHHHRKRWIIGIVVAALVVIGLVTWLIIRKHRENNPTPMETLQQLKDTSRPVDKTVEERATALKQVSTKAAVSQQTMTKQQRLDMLKMLEK